MKLDIQMFAVDTAPTISYQNNYIDDELESVYAILTIQGELGCELESIYDSEYNNITYEWNNYVGEDGYEIPYVYYKEYFMNVEETIIVTYKDNGEPKTTQLSININEFDEFEEEEGDEVEDDELEYRGETTLFEIFKNICDIAEVETSITEFAFGDMKVSWYDNSYTARDYLSFIAELNGTNFIIDPQGKLEFQDFNKEPVANISFDEISDYKIGDKHVITRVVWDDTNNKWEYGDETGDTYYINTSNVYITSPEHVEYIYNKIKGLEFYNFKTSDCPSDAFQLGKIVNFTDGVNNYPTISQYDKLTYHGGYWFGGVELDVNTEKQQETEVLGLIAQIRALKTIVDRDNNTITQIATSTKRNANTLKELQETMQTQMDETKLQIEAIQKSNDEVDSLRNSLITIDINGITVSTNLSAISTFINNETFAIKSGDTYLAYFGYDAEKGQTVAEMDNLTINKYLVAGYHRIEKFEVDGEKRTGYFYIGGDN